MEDKYKDYIELYHICLPIKAHNSVSMDNGYWRPWNPDEKHLWVRELPENSINIYNHNFGDYYNENMTDYDFNLSFSKWYSNQKKVKPCA